MIRHHAAQYVAHQRASGRLSDAAARGVTYTLASLADAVPDDPRRVQPRHVQAWIDQPGLAPRTRQRRLSVARNFFRWLQLHGHTTKNPAELVTAPRAPEALPRYLTGDEVARLLDHAPDHRARLIVLLMVQEGLRCVEVSRLEVPDIDLTRRTVAVRGKGGHGHRTRVLPLSEQTTTAAVAVLRCAAAAGGPLIRSYSTGDPLSPQYISDMVRDWMTRAGLRSHRYDGKTAHALRHTMAQHLADQGADVLAIQRALGHASVATTQCYLRGAMDVDRLRDVMGRRHYGDDAA